MELLAPAIREAQRAGVIVAYVTECLDGRANNSYAASLSRVMVAVLLDGISFLISNRSFLRLVFLLLLF